MIQGNGFTIHISKFDYFFGRVASSPSNQTRSLQNLQDLSRLGINMQLQIIEESDFNQLDPVRQVIVHDYPQKFARLNIEGTLGSYGISWRSELIEPITKVSTAQNVVWIGVDEQLAAICLNRGNIRLVLTLNNYIFQILIVDNITAVLTEDEVWLFNPTLSIRYIKALPDIAAEMLVKGTDLVIQLITGESWLLNTQTGSLNQLATPTI